MRFYEVIVVGGGAAGLMAAATSASGGKSTLLLERMEKPARKIRITGKGRCNITNTKSLHEFLKKVRTNVDFVLPALEKFSNNDIIELFEAQGLKLIRERGDRVFPSTGRAWGVAEALINYAKKNGAAIECHSRAVGILTDKGRVTGLIKTDRNGRKEKISTNNIILATGGASYPLTGSNGDGYQLAFETGHDIVPIRPALTPLIVGNKYRKLDRLVLKNISVSLELDGAVVKKEFGEMEFIENTATGAVIIKLSRDAVDGIIEGKKTALCIDLKPALGKEQIAARIEREISVAPKDADIGYLMVKMMPKQFISVFLADCELKPSVKLSGIARNLIDKIVEKLKNFRIDVLDYGPFPKAIITAGGIATENIDPQTMQSKIVEGLYFAGEMMDIDADTGGYNLQIAFSTGKLAGELKK